MKSLLLAFILSYSFSSYANLARNFELSAQSYTDSIKMKRQNSPDIPLLARSYGLYGAYGSCLKSFKSRNCLHLSGGAGVSWSVVESNTDSYTYKDSGVMTLQGFGALGYQFQFPKTLATALVSGDVEARNAKYRTPTDEYNLREEEMSFHYWLKFQFNFPISRTASFTQSFLFSPFSSDFTYRIGISL